ncbi:hypothetical protein [Nocardioides sp. PD653]|uniref:hypothetical protein n=1 Tax=Nocardioides sp. PD653 TaxID=393303 RepID=UPI001054157A|nr:hypothetical protein [Nocardioides sp. PD653]
MTRQQKTPRQRAEEQLAIANRAVERLNTKAKALRQELDAVDREHRAALARRDHLATHPDLHAVGPGEITSPRTTTSTGDPA